MRFSTGSSVIKCWGNGRSNIISFFSVFQYLHILFFNNISSEHFCSEKSVLFCTEMKCSLGFSTCRCAVIYLLTVADSEDFICNSDLKLTNFKVR